MTRKDYILIAAAIKETKESVALEAFNNSIDAKTLYEVLKNLNLVSVEISKVMKRDNIRFDVERFLNACNLNS